ncbi:MAG: NAD(P)H-binding protein [Bacteroidia bacterium]
MGFTALIIGATGLVGSSLLEQLISDAQFSAIHSFGRRDPEQADAKHKEHLVDFDKPDSWKEALHGDVLFSALGTTIKQAGSKEVQYKIDFTYQYQTAINAAENGVKHYVLISSAGASTQSNVFYSKMKGELEEAIIKLPFEKITILQPSLLTGPRKEFRLGERLSYWLLLPLSLLPFIKKYRPIPANTVARAMINAVLYPSKKRVHRVAWGEVFELAKSPKS